MRAPLSIPAESKRSLYRVVGQGFLLFGLAAALALAGYEGRSAERPLTVLLGVHDDLGLRIAGIAVGLAVAGVGYGLWRANGGRRRP
jgi:F0F1-type ATP synthase membrane subunit c/vacuolar-type H+-ATPase subunit K